MLTTVDLKKLGSLIDTKLANQDLTRVGSLVDTKLIPIKIQLDRIETKLIVSFDHLDRRLIDHDKRLNRVDDHLKFPKLTETPPSKYILKLQHQLAQ